MNVLTTIGLALGVMYGVYVSMTFVKEGSIGRAFTMVWVGQTISLICTLAFSVAAHVEDASFRDAWAAALRWTILMATVWPMSVLGARLRESREIANELQKRMRQTTKALRGKRSMESSGKVSDGRRR